MKSKNLKVHKKKITSEFAKRAKVYGKASWTRDKDFLKTAVDFADLRKNDTVLEIGIGTGLIANEVQKKVKALYGIDPSADMLKQLPDTIDRANIIVGIGEKLPYLDNVFDVTYWRSVIMHLIDPQKMIDESYRVTKKGGRVFFSEPVGLTNAERNFYFSGLNLKDDTHHFYFTDKELYQRISKAGYKKLKHKIFITKMIYSGWMKGGSVNQKRQKQIWDYYVNAPKKFKENLNIEFTKDDFVFDLKWIILKGEKI